MSAVKAPRQSNASKAGSIISISRVRNYIDKNGLNGVQQKEIDNIGDQLTDVQKESGPNAPPKAPSKTSETYDAELKEWKALVEAYKDFKSGRYQQLYKVYMFYKYAKKLTEFLRKTDPTEKTKEEVRAILDILNDHPAPKAKTETDEHYTARVQTFQAPGFKDLYVGCRDPANPDNVDQYLTELRATNKGLELFLRKDELSHQKVRFNDEAVISITACCETLISECIKYAMTNAVDNGKKIIKADHLTSGTKDNIQDSSLYALFGGLPHFVALLDRHDRRVQHELDTKVKRVEMHKEARERARKETGKYTKDYSPDFSVLKTFEEAEVAAGHAVVVHLPPTKAKQTESADRVGYVWNAIDKPLDPTDTVSFDYYINDVCDAVREKNFQDPSFAADSIKVSKEFKQFMSNLTIDFFARLAPQLRILLNYTDVKTVDFNTVLTALKSMLLSTYQCRDGVVNWSADHQAFFDQIKKRVDNWRLSTASAKDTDATSVDAAMAALVASDLEVHAIATQEDNPTEQVAEPTASAVFAAVGAPTEPAVEAAAPVAQAPAVRRGPVRRR